MAEPSGIVGVVLWALSWVFGGGGGVAATPLHARAEVSMAGSGVRAGGRQPGATAPKPAEAKDADAKGAAPVTPGGVTTRTAEQYAELLIEADDELKREEYPAAEAAVRAAGTKEPANWKYKTALAALLTGRREHEQAVKLTEEATKLDPKSARAWYWRGQAKFNHLGETRSLDSIGEIDDAKAAMLKAIELDAKFPAPRMAMAMFYIEAPGIVGGSIRKAREQGNTLLTLGDDGPMLGRVVLARCAVYKEEWDEARRQYAAMEEAATTPLEKYNAILGWARTQIVEQEDAKGGLATIDRALAVAPDDQQRSGAWYLRGQAKRALKDVAGAIESYRQVLVVKPDAKLTRFALAECLEQTKDYAGAAEQYAEYAKRFAADEKAGEAKKKAERLAKKK